MNPCPKPMPKLRFQSPDRLLGATEYSKDETLRGSLNTVRLVKSQPQITSVLRQACSSLEINHGRKREPGQWELAAVAFVASRQVDIQPWWDETTDELWRECGFAGKPPYNRVWERLRELEKVGDAFLDAAATVIQHCRKHDPRVLAHVHFDSSEDETHSALLHDCQAGESCARSTAQRGSALRPRRAPTVEAREQREKWNEEDPADAKEHAREAGPEADEPTKRGKGRRVRVGGCWYRTRDEEAGVRAYKRNGKTTRFWHGYFSAKAIDHLTGGVIPSVDAASKQEYDIFPALFDRVCTMAGAAPQTVIGDKGYSVESCFQHATTHGTAPVFPWRRGNKRKREDHLTHDRHGVMRCRHCGGETKQKRFALENGKPWLWFECIAPRLPECHGQQRIRCETDWRSLIPLSRLDPLYHELKASHQAYEGVHDYWRDRYRVAADTLANRPKAVGLDWHRLRANVACLIDWLRIATVNGWIGSARATRRGKGVRTKMDAGAKAAASLIKRRSKYGLDLPYGPNAKALGIGKETPPSRRPRPAPLPVSPAPPGP